jgi:hypothetical protein
LGVPIAGIAGQSTALFRHFLGGDRELVALAGADHEMALPAVADLAGDRIVEKAVLEPIDDEHFQTVERLTETLVGHILHEPTVGLKEGGPSERLEKAASVKSLFRLDEPPE